MPNVKTIRTSTDARGKDSVKPTIVSVGVYPACGREFVRPYECTHAACDCESARLIPLELAMVIDKKSYAKLSNLAKFANVSVQRVLEVLLETYIEKLEEKGLINLCKEVTE